ncbi:MAG: ATP-dependent metallopeptidase FtsH/Yme1/Tma family protein [Candidatus Magasanikbacteria bacterium]|nr:ATP-dependent metallopeptidase FtsH/Yme1/Tma family protein [Candidatus Magasanikbacteria bacterium]
MAEKGDDPGVKQFVKNFLLVFFGLLIIAGIISSGNFFGPKPEVVSISKLVQEVQAGEVKKLTVRGSRIEIVLDKEDKEQVVQKEPGESVVELLTRYGVTSNQLANVEVRIESEKGARYVFSILLPFLVPIIVIGALMWYMARQMQGASNRALMFGESRAKQIKDEKGNQTTFKDVAGSREAKQELEEVVEFLKHPKKFADAGARIPKGVLLLGPPGTGKTLLARAVAGEAEVPFFHMSGSEFVEMFVGVGASRVRDLFTKAKKAAPAIVFIDEIDAVGRRRGAGLGGSHDEREQTLNQILVEMDGFDPNIGVIVIAATNRPDVLDPALLRPGRFDRRVTIDHPDIKERQEILIIHARGKHFSEEVSLRKVAERTPGFTGADLSNLLNEAAILAVRRGKKTIGELEVFESIEKVLLGPERKSRIISEKERKITAYHEAGHALIAHFFPNADPVRKVSIVARGRAGGYTLKMPTEDKHYHAREEFMDDLAVALGGYVAEEMIFGKGALSTGPSSDLRQATQLAREMVTQYGMSELLGPRTFGSSDEVVFLGKEMHEGRDYSEKTAEHIDGEVSKLIKDAKLRAEKLLKDKRDVMERVVGVLLEKETLEQEEFNNLVAEAQPAP